jgi:Flp pilus assembly protein TadD
LNAVGCRPPRTAASICLHILRGRIAELAVLVSFLLWLSGCSLSAPRRNIDGVRQYQLGRYHEAIQSFQRALAASPNDADAYYNLGATYYALGKINRDPNTMGQAEGLYHQCLDINPEHPACYRGLAALLVDTNRSESAFTLLRHWATHNPQSAEARIELGRLHEEFGQKETAVQYLSEALNLDARNSRAWMALGRIREQQGQMTQALANYQQAYQLNRFQPGLGDRIATLQRSMPGMTSPGWPPGPQVVTAPNATTAR